MKNRCESYECKYGCTARFIMYDDKIEKIMNKVKGKLIIKEYPEHQLILIIFVHYYKNYQ